MAYRPLPHYIFILSQSKCAEVNITALHFIGKAYGESKLATLLTEIANFEVRVNTQGAQALICVSVVCFLVYLF